MTSGYFFYFLGVCSSQFVFIYLLLTLPPLNFFVKREERGRVFRRKGYSKRKELRWMAGMPARQVEGGLGKTDFWRHASDGWFAARVWHVTCPSDSHAGAHSLLLDGLHSRPAHRSGGDGKIASPGVFVIIFCPSRSPLPPSVLF